MVLPGRLQRERRRGATALEYVLLVTVVAIVFSFGAAMYGGAIGGLFVDIGQGIEPVKVGKIGGNPHDPGETGDPHDDDDGGDPH